MQLASSVERPPLAGLLAIAATLWLAQLTPARPAPQRLPMCPRLACSSELISAHEFGRAAFLFELQREPRCAHAARQLRIIYYVAMVSNTERAEALAAVQRTLEIDHRAFGDVLHRELAARRRELTADR